MKSRLKNAVTTLIGPDATVNGNLVFELGCHVGGIVKGDVSAPGDGKSELAVAPTGRIEGNAGAARMLIQGTIVGDLCCKGTVTLTSTARVEGSIEYGQIEMEKGAVVTGQLLIISADSRSSGDSAGGAATAAHGSNPAPAKPVQPALN